MAPFTPGEGQDVLPCRPRLVLRWGEGIRFDVWMSSVIVQPAATDLDETSMHESAQSVFRGSIRPRLRLARAHPFFLDG